MSRRAEVEGRRGNRVERLSRVFDICQILTSEPMVTGEWVRVKKWQDAGLMMRATSLIFLIQGVHKIPGQLDKSLVRHFG